MKKLALCSIVIVLLTGCKHVGSKFELSGNIIGDTTGIVVLSQVGRSRSDAKTSQIVNGKFHIIGSNLENPEEFSLYTEKPNQRQFTPIRIFISPNDEIEIDLNTGDIEASVVRGSLINDEYQQYRNTVERYGVDKLDLLSAEYENVKLSNDTLKMNHISIQRDSLFNELTRIRTLMAYDYIKSHPESFVSAYSLYDYRNTLDVKQVDELLNLIDKKLYQSKYIYYIVNADRNQQGTKASDFTLNDSQNNEVVFSRFSKDKIVLIDFWASWCLPCRRANPQLEKIYQQYKDRGFEILGISLDRDIQTLRKSIEEDQISWTNLIDTQGNRSVKELYNVSTLPANILIDRNGIVVARNIRDISDVEIEKLLK